jgi:pseudo-rSAM protein
MNSFWLYIEPYVHISAKLGKALLYNVLNGQTICIEENEDLICLVRQLDSPENLRTIGISKDTLSKPEVRAFISRLKRSFMGDLLDSSWSTIKPVQIPPIVRVEKDLKRLLDSGLWKNESLSQFLSEMSFFVCHRSNRDIPLLEDAFRQFLVPCGVGRLELSVEDVEKTVDGLTLSTINLLGGNIFEYSEFDRLLKSMARLSATKTLFAVYSDFERNEKAAQLRGVEIELNIAVPPPVSIVRLRSVASYVDELGLKSSFGFIVTSDSEVRVANEIASDLGILEWTMNPYFDGTNLSFFQRRVFMTKAEIVASRPSVMEIARKRELNPLGFGRLTVLPDGNVYGNLNRPPLGRLAGQSMTEIILEEMKQKDEWFTTRHEFAPCKECVFEFMCPPPSHYEDVIGRHDLCHVS